MTDLPAPGDLIVADIVGLGRECVRVVAVHSPQDIEVRVVGFTHNLGVRVVISAQQFVDSDDWRLRDRDGLVAFA